jgi:hypothetical protein
LVIFLILTVFIPNIFRPSARVIFCTIPCDNPEYSNCLGQLLSMGGLLLEVRHTKQPSFILTVNKKACALERACIVAQDGAIGLIFERDIPPEKNDTKKWCR